MALYAIAETGLGLGVLFAVFAWLARRERGRALVELIRQLEEHDRYDSLRPPGA